MYNICHISVCEVLWEITLQKQSDLDHAEEQAELVFDTSQPQNIQNLIASGGPNQTSQQKHDQNSQLSQTNRKVKHDLKSICRVSHTHTHTQLILSAMLDIRSLQKNAVPVHTSSWIKRKARVNITTHSSLIRHVATRIAELSWPENNHSISNKRLNNHSARPDCRVFPHPHHVSTLEPQSHLYNVKKDNKNINLGLYHRLVLLLCVFGITT